MQKTKTGWLLLGIVWALAACNAAGQEEITATVAIPTSTTVPAKATSVPAATFAPTATLRSDGPLNDEGPYLIYNDVEEGVNSIVLVNGDGSGRKIIPLPENSTIDNLRTALSPDGQWLAFHVGSLSKDFEGAADDHLTLNLMHLPDGEITEVANLLSDDFMDKFQLLADSLFTREENQEYMISSEDYLSSIWMSFRYRFDTFSWSPLGNYLAFSAQTEGLSSDVYLYDVQTQTTSRLSDEIGNVQFVKWSPNETYLLFGATYEVSVGDTDTYYLANIKQGSVDEISNNLSCGGNSSTFGEWISEYEVIAYCEANGWG